LKSRARSSLTADPVRVLRDPATIRARAHMLLALARENKLRHFTLQADKLPVVADYTAEVIRQNYPDLAIPYHGRWRHFGYGSIDRWGDLAGRFSNAEEMVRAAIDLAVISVLLDAGAGAQWKYKEEGRGGMEAGRSEGLALASFHMFRHGLFSSDARQPLRVDAGALALLDERKLAQGFQAGPRNPMAGLEGRIQLIKSLALALTAHPELFGRAISRPGNLYDALGKGKAEVRAADILAALLDGFETIWPGRIIVQGRNLGDVWMHRALEFDDETNHLMPFHKLSQWLTYSLLEPFEWAGAKVTGLDALTGLAEYRNGGLFVDMGVLALRNPRDVEKSYQPSDELIVEWRALTLALLDELRLPVAGRLGLKPESFPLARLLEGGTWQAGRKIAREKRTSADPPLKIMSDGTVF
jgi:hypothetical protein